MQGYAQTDFNIVLATYKCFHLKKQLKLVSFSAYF